MKGAELLRSFLICMKNITIVHTVLNNRLLLVVFAGFLVVPAGSLWAQMPGQEMLVPAQAETPAPAQGVPGSSTLTSTPESTQAPQTPIRVIPMATAAISPRSTPKPVMFATPKPSQTPSVTNRAPTPSVSLSESFLPAPQISNTSDGPNIPLLASVASAAALAGLAGGYAAASLACRNRNGGKINTEKKRNDGGSCKEIKKLLDQKNKELKRLAVQCPDKNLLLELLSKQIEEAKEKAQQAAEDKPLSVGEEQDELSRQIHKIENAMRACIEDEFAEQKDVTTNPRKATLYREKNYFDIPGTSVRVYFSGEPIRQPLSAYINGPEIGKLVDEIANLGAKSRALSSEDKPGTLERVKNAKDAYDGLMEKLKQAQTEADDCETKKKIIEEDIKNLENRYRICMSGFPD